MTLTLAALISGCSSWGDAHKQTVSVQTYEASELVSGIDCQLTNDRGQWSVTTPGQVQVITSAQDLVVTCKQNALTIGIASAVARPSPGYLDKPYAAVVVPAGAPSSIKQLLDGVDQTYPETIEVLMNQEIMVTSSE